MFTKFKKTKNDPLKGLGAYKQIKRHERTTAEIYDANRATGRHQTNGKVRFYRICYCQFTTISKATWKISPDFM